MQLLRNTAADEPGELVGASGTRPASEYARAYRSLFERSGIGMALLNSELRVLDANPTFRTAFGVPVEVVEGREILDILHLDDSELRKQLVWLASGWLERVVGRIRARHRAAVLTAVSNIDAAPRVIVLLQWEERNGLAGDGVQLTELDARVLEGVAMGMSTVDLAAKLYLSRQSVEYHVRTMLRKFRASNRPELVSRAYSIGVLNGGEWPPRVSPEFVKG